MFLLKPPHFSSTNNQIAFAFLIVSPARNFTVLLTIRLLCSYLDKLKTGTGNTTCQPGCKCTTGVLAKLQVTITLCVCSRLMLEFLRRISSYPICTIKSLVLQNSRNSHSKSLDLGRSTAGILTSLVAVWRILICEALPVLESPKSQQLG